MCVCATNQDTLYCVACLGFISSDVTVDVQTFAERWFESGGGNTQILTDIEVENLLSSSSEEAAAHNLVLLGGPASNSIARRLQNVLPIQFLPASESRSAENYSGAGMQGIDPADLGAYYYGIADCLFGPSGYSLVALGPLDGEGSGVVAVVDGQHVKAFMGAGEILVDGLFDVNHWQHRQADYVIANSGVGTKGARAVVATGFWGNSWEYVQEASYLDC